MKWWILAASVLTPASSFVVPPATYAAASSSSRHRSISRAANFAAFSSSRLLRGTKATTATTATTALQASTDPVSYWRVEYVSSAMLSNQIPRSASTVLQLGTVDPKAVYYLNKDVNKLLCHPSYSAVQGGVSPRANRQLTQAKERRGGMDKLELVCLRTERLDGRATKQGGFLYGVDDNSVDAVVFCEVLEEIIEFYAKPKASASILGSDEWFRNLLEELNRVLKVGGRLVFVEKRDIAGLLPGPSAVPLVGAIEGMRMDGSFKLFADGETEGMEGDDEREMDEVDLGTYSLFDVAYDQIDFCPTPHVAGVAIKRSIEEPFEEEEESEPERVLNIQERIEYEKRVQGAELAIAAFEKGRKKRKKLKPKADEEGKDQVGKWARGSELKSEATDSGPMKALQNSSPMKTFQKFITGIYYSGKSEEERAKDKEGR